MASKLHVLSIPIRGGGRAIGLAIAGSVLGSMVGEPLKAMDLLPGWIPLGVVLAVLFGFGALVYEGLRYRHYRYELTAETLNIDSGVLFRREREIPLGRVQNVDISRSILQRVLGIADVGIETAGGSSTEASLQYVSHTEATRLQEGIRTRKRDLDRSDGEQGTAEGDATTPDTETKVLFELDDESLILYSLLSFDPRVLSVLFVVLPVVAPFFSPTIEGRATAVLVVGGVGVLVLLGLGIWLTSAFSRFVNYYGFSLTRVGEELRYERGLLQRYDGSIPEEKIQTVVIEENVFMRAFGYASLSIETAGYGPEAAEETDSAVPLAERDRLIELAREVEAFDALEFERPAPQARRRYLARYALAITAILAVAFGVNLWMRPIPWYAIAGLYALIPTAARKQWEHRGWALPEGYVATRNGFWQRRIHVVPDDRVQTVLDQRTIFQRRWGLGTVVVDTASSGGFVAAEAQAVDVSTERAAELRETVTDRLLSSLGIDGPASDRD
jgi:putative membrane protein